MEDNLLVFSVDDHIIEPPHTWVDRLPSKYRDIGPRIVTRDVNPLHDLIPEKARDFVNRRSGNVELWAYEDTLTPTTAITATVGKKPEEYGIHGLNFSEMAVGCYNSAARIIDMDADGVVASVGFPSYPRFCGQVFLEAKDKELALLCVKAYNDFIVEEWCAAAPRRFVPLCIVPLWDPHLAADEVRRVADLGARGIAFCENPAKLGIPSLHTPGHWDPLFAACEETEMVVCIHIGSSSDTLTTAVDAPLLVWLSLVSLNSPIATVDWLFSGVFLRHPRLQVALSEGEVGWIPFMLGRADYEWEHQRQWAGSELPEPPSEYFRRNMHGCFIHDPFGAANLRSIGIDNVMLEVDYPHSDTTFPNTLEKARLSLGYLTAEELFKVTQGNAMKLFRFTPAGIGQL